MNCAIVDYGSGNLRSAEKAFLRAARDAAVGCDISVTADPDVVARADRVVVPGVGAFADCMEGLAATDGMLDAVRDAAERRAVPLLGVCVGMQLFASRGLEHREKAGFGWVPGDVKRIEPADTALKVPHMGWNTLGNVKPHPVLSGIPTGAEGWHAYFVHSYALDAANDDHVLATTTHGGPITAVVGRDTLVGTQFHPEKSQKLGLRLIANFLSWTP
ncbi:MAG: imidazole glycerol phosphate synthase subunit HisH [Pseudomonadota bacterium]